MLADTPRVFALWRIVPGARMSGRLENLVGNGDLKSARKGQQPERERRGCWKSAVEGVVKWRRYSGFHLNTQSSGKL